MSPNKSCYRQKKKFKLKTGFKIMTHCHGENKLQNMNNYKIVLFFEKLCRKWSYIPFCK